ncbi:MAG TPA: peptidoglycan DD-metalloendopeptidase family protein [Candidatus Faecimorpha stercoravium]|nr:peptidoglycan DD-metalloendopeptidase family protein [Candidatus Faecimorpha stercoravium]
MQKQKKARAIRCGIAFVLAMILILSSVAPLMAADLDTLKQEKEELENQAASNQAEQSSTQALLEGVSAELAAVLTEISVLDEEINTCMQNISQLESEIADNETLLSETQANLDQAKADEAQHFEELKARLQMMYEYGDVNYLEVLLGSKDISDFFSRIEYVGQMAEYDQGIQDNLEADRQKIQELEGQIQQTELELNLAKQNLENEKKVLEDTRSEKQARQAELESSQEMYQEYLTYLDNLEAELQSQIEAKQDEIAAEEARQEEIRRQEEEEAKKEQEQGSSGGSSSSDSSESGSSGGSSSSGGPSSGGGSTGTFIWPVPSSHYISSPYGYRIHPIYGGSRLHAGVDIGASHGQSILAADGGTVTYAGYNSSYGYFVMISHPSTGYVTLYAHCSQLLVYTGQQVSQGDVIALIGSTGDSTGPHCHFEVRINGSTTDPMNFF